MKPVTRAWLELHIAVVLFGFTAILGKLIELDAVVLVWWRVFFTALSLLFLIQIRHVFFEMPRRVILRFMGVGVLVGLHWVTFFAAIHWSNASVCLVAMATASLFTAVLEPLLLRQKVKWFEIMLGTAIIPGLFLIADNVALSMHLGLGVGLISAFLMALF
ncbi:MAG: EamA/RhaT family transporter, partial [Bacteroidetes bacterium]